MANFVVRFPSATSLGAGEVRLIKTASGAWADGAIMTYDSTNKAYELIVTGGVQFGAGVFSPSETYLVSYSADGGATQTVIHDLIMIGDMYTWLALVTHAALHDNVHGVIGHVVGISDTQTLTNKTIDGDLNTLLDISFASMKAATAAPAHYIKPGADDTALHIDTSSATKFTATASNVAKALDRIMEFVCGSLNLKNLAGAAIKITNVAPATAAGDAVEFAQFDALKTRVTALDAGTAFSPTPVVILSPTGQSKTQVGICYDMALAADKLDVSRWEVYWSQTSMGWLSAGAISAGDLLRLQNQCGANKDVFRASAGGVGRIATHTKIWITVVAYDGAATPAQIAAAPITMQPEADGSKWVDSTGLAYLQLDTPRSLNNYESNAGTATGNTATAVLEWTQDDTTPTAKAIRVYKKLANDITLTLGYWAKTASTLGYIKMELFDRDLTAKGNVVATINNAAYATLPAVQPEISLDVSGFADGDYIVKISCWSADSNATKLRSDFKLDAINRQTIQ